MKTIRKLKFSAGRSQLHKPQLRKPERYIEFNPVDDEEMSDGDNEGRADVPPAARRFLTAAAAGRFAGGSDRTAQGLFNRLDKKGSESGESEEDSYVQRAAADGSDVDVPDEPEIR